MTAQPAPRRGLPMSGLSQTCAPSDRAHDAETNSTHDGRTTDAGPVAGGNKRKAAESADEHPTEAARVDAVVEGKLAALA